MSPEHCPPVDQDQEDIDYEDLYFPPHNGTPEDNTTNATTALREHQLSQKSAGTPEKISHSVDYTPVLNVLKPAHNSTLDNNTNPATVSQGSGNNPEKRSHSVDYTPVSNVLIPLSRVERADSTRKESSQVSNSFYYVSGLEYETWVT